MRSRPIVWRLVSVFFVFIVIALGAQTYFSIQLFRQFHEELQKESVDKDRITAERGEDEKLTPLYYRMINLFVVILIPSMIATFIWAWRVLSPIRGVKVLAERMAMGELIQIRDFSFLSSSELRGLGVALNRISEQLGRNFSKYRAKKNEQGAILASMSEGVLAVDERERVTHINKAAAEMFNLSSTSALGLTIYELIRTPHLQDFVRESLSVKDFDQKEITLDEGGADMKVLFIRCTPLRGMHGQRLGTVFVLSDITELRKLERMRRDFVANVSHELRTPLTSIKGFSETIMNIASEKTDENVKKFIEIVYRHANRLESLIEDLLMLSKLEGDDESSKKDFSMQKLAGVVASSIDICRERAAQKNIKLEGECPPDLMFFGNPNLIEQALVNLIDNAIKYSAEGKAVKVVAFEALQEVQIQVIDSGIGIAKENFDRLFERFYRVDKGRSRDMGGTGLGLSIVKHIVQVHSGRVDVESQVGRGSKFTIHLPKMSNINHILNS